VSNFGYFGRNLPQFINARSINKETEGGKRIEECPVEQLSSHQLIIHPETFQQVDSHYGNQRHGFHCWRIR
jgi:hypothetical protein